MGPRTHRDLTLHINPPTTLPLCLGTWASHVVRTFPAQPRLHWEYLHIWGPDCMSEDMRGWGLASSLPSSLSVQICSYPLKGDKNSSMISTWEGRDSEIVACVVAHCLCHRSWVLLCAGGRTQHQCHQWIDSSLVAFHGCLGRQSIRTRCAVPSVPPNHCPKTEWPQRKSIKQYTHQRLQHWHLPVHSVFDVLSSVDVSTTRSLPSFELGDECWNFF